MVYKTFLPFEGVVAFTSNKNTMPEPTPRFTGDSADSYMGNRKALGKLLVISPGQMVFPRQTHSNKVEVILEIPKKEIQDADALVTNIPGICLCIQTADCVPILLFDPVKKVIAAVHAGWRGTVQKILFHTAQKMKSDFQCQPETILAVIGPSISQGNYEVGKEVINTAKTKLTDAEKFFLPGRQPEKAYFDLWETNKAQLIEAGLKDSHIEISGLCSYHHASLFYSARREGPHTGRMASGIMLKKLSL